MRSNLIPASGPIYMSQVAASCGVVGPLYTSELLPGGSYVHAAGLVVGPRPLYASSLRPVPGPSSNGAAGPLVAASASNVAYAMSGFFSAPTAGSVFSLSNNPLGNAAVGASSGVLTLTGVAGCNAQFPLAVLLTDPSGQSASEVVEVTSVAPPAATAAIAGVTVTAGSNAAFSLPAYFSTVYGAPLAYSLVYPGANVQVGGGGGVAISLSGASAPYTVWFQCTDAVGQTASTSVVVDEVPSAQPVPPSSSAIPPVSAAFQSTVTVPLPSYFSSTAPLTYSLSDNPRPDAWWIDNDGNLIIFSQSQTATACTVTCMAADSFGQTASASIAVTELGQGLTYSITVLPSNNGVYDNTFNRYDLFDVYYTEVNQSTQDSPQGVTMANAAGSVLTTLPLYSANAAGTQVQLYTAPRNAAAAVGYVSGSDCVGHLLTAFAADGAYGWSATLVAGGQLERSDACSYNGSSTFAYAGLYNGAASLSLTVAGTPYTNDPITSASAGNAFVLGLDKVTGAPAMALRFAATRVRLAPAASGALLVACSRANSGNSIAQATIGYGLGGVSSVRPSFFATVAAAGTNLYVFTAAAATGMPQSVGVKFFGGGTYVVHAIRTASDGSVVVGCSFQGAGTMRVTGATGVSASVTLPSSARRTIIVAKFSAVLVYLFGINIVAADAAGVAADISYSHLDVTESGAIAVAVLPTAFGFYHTYRLGSSGAATLGGTVDVSSTAYVAAAALIRFDGTTGALGTWATFGYASGSASVCLLSCVTWVGGENVAVSFVVNGGDSGLTSDGVFVSSVDGTTTRPLYNGSSPNFSPETNLGQLADDFVAVFDGNCGVVYDTTMYRNGTYWMGPKFDCLYEASTHTMVYGGAFAAYFDYMQYVDPTTSTKYAVTPPDVTLYNGSAVGIVRVNAATGSYIQPVY